GYDAGFLWGKWWRVVASSGNGGEVDRSREDGVAGLAGVGDEQ
nr:hypothetical protein [Tanacetum cinerariifolium]GFC95800.1 hypothetical protein [Tanacetum cinerariifolium]